MTTPLQSVCHGSLLESLLLIRYDISLIKLVKELKTHNLLPKYNDKLVEEVAQETNILFKNKCEMMW